MLGMRSIRAGTEHRAEALACRKAHGFQNGIRRRNRVQRIGDLNGPLVFQLEAGDVDGIAVTVLAEFRGAIAISPATFETGTSVKHRYAGLGFAPDGRTSFFLDPPHEAFGKA